MPHNVQTKQDFPFMNSFFIFSNRILRSGLPPTLTVVGTGPEFAASDIDGLSEVEGVTDVDGAVSKGSELAAADIARLPTAELADTDEVGLEFVTADISGLLEGEYLTAEVGGGPEFAAADIAGPLFSELKILSKHFSIMLKI